MYRARSELVARPSVRWAALAFFGVLLGPSGCSHHVGTTAASFLREVREGPDPNARFLAYAKLAAPNCYDTEGQKREAVTTLLEKLDKGKEPVATRAQICQTLGALRDPSARESMVRLTGDPEPIVRVEACRALGRVGRSEDSTVLARVMMVDTQEDCRIAAIDALAELKSSDSRIAQVLLNGMQHDDPAIRLASLNALKQCTGKDLGLDALAWQKELGGGAPVAEGAAPAVMARRGAKRGAVDAAAKRAAYPPRVNDLGPEYGLGGAAPGGLPGKP